MENKQIIEITHNTKSLDVVKPAFKRALNVGELVLSSILSLSSIGFAGYSLAQTPVDSHFVAYGAIGAVALPLFVHVGRAVLDYIFNLNK